jgi:hypothetical protein
VARATRAASLGGTSLATFYVTFTDNTLTCPRLGGLSIRAAILLTRPDVIVSQLSTNKTAAIGMNEADGEKPNYLFPLTKKGN